MADEPKMKKPNPIAFNPDTMTVSALKYCADTLHTIFRAIDQENDPANIVAHLEDFRDQMLRRYGVPR